MPTDMPTDNQIQIATVKELIFTPHGVARGQLIAIEAGSPEIPFEVKRCYYIFDTTPNTLRGLHAHKELKQVLICTSGACTIDCELNEWHCGSWGFDTAEELAVELAKLMALTDEERVAMGKRGQELIRTNYSWEGVGKKMKMVYAWLLGQGDNPEWVRVE